MKKYISIVIVLTLILLTITACNYNQENDKQQSITIAEQYGLAYAPVQLIKELKLLEEAAPNLKVRWKHLSNTAAIRESMLAGEVDIAFMAIPPFLIAKDKGMEWKIFSGLAESPLGLMSNRKYLNSISDIKNNDKIALPQPGSIQHILLSMAAENQFKNSKKFDSQLLTMKHPDAMNALLAKKEVSAHFASPPYIFLESKEQGIKKILSGKEAFGGEFSFIIGVSTKQFYQQQPQKYKIFSKALQKSLDFLNQNPGEAAELLAANYQLEPKEMFDYLTWPGMKFNSKINGLAKFIDFLVQEKYIEKDEYQYSDLVFNKALGSDEQSFLAKQRIFLNAE